MFYAHTQIYLIVYRVSPEMVRRYSNISLKSREHLKRQQMPLSNHLRLSLPTSTSLLFSILLTLRLWSSLWLNITMKTIASSWCWTCRSIFSQIKTSRNGTTALPSVWPTSLTTAMWSYLSPHIQTLIEGTCGLAMIRITGLALPKPMK